MTKLEKLIEFLEIDIASRKEAVDNDDESPLFGRSDTDYVDGYLAGLEDTLEMAKGFLKEKGD